MSDCPICKQNNGCQVDNVLVVCRHTRKNKPVEGYRVLHEAVTGKGWVWEPVKVLAELNGSNGQKPVDEGGFELFGDESTDSKDVIDDDGRTFNQKAHEKLYSQSKWVCFANDLYIWEGNYYRLVSDDEEIPRIQIFCDSYTEEKNIGTKAKPCYISVYPHANPRSVLDVLKWVKMKYTKDMCFVNPPGINCSNGVVQLTWVGRDLTIELVKHDPLTHYYTSAPSIKYDPKANPKYYEKMMECLDDGARQIWERTIAASIDMLTIRKYGSRTVKALFLKGDGSNGKDSLKRITQILFGRGAMSACSCTDWQQYDEGRYFTIYSLQGKRINWPSENADAGRVDRLQGLKSAITGDEIIFERKGRDPQSGEPQAVFLFNINENPNLLAQLKATASRWAIIPFDKTYSDNPGMGELKADSRFKDDPDFLKQKVVPAFLNKILEQLQNVVRDGIDYSATQETMDSLQKDSCHLLRFAEDEGLRYIPNSTVTPSEIWDRLKAWYLSEGILTVDHVYNRLESAEKNIWVAQANPLDFNVKGANQVMARFLELFPKAKQGSGLDKNKNKKLHIIGLGFESKQTPSPERDPASTDLDDFVYER
jgi:putative DNA primase/helicase